MKLVGMARRWKQLDHMHARWDVYQLSRARDGILRELAKARRHPDRFERNYRTLALSQRLAYVAGDLAAVVAREERLRRELED